MECHGSVDSVKSEPMCLFISVGEPEHNVVSLVTMGVAPGVCGNKAGEWIH